MKTYPIHDLFNGRISLSPCPLGHERLVDEIKSLKEQNYKLVISMLTAEEQEKHGLIAEFKQCTMNNIVYLNYPIKDEIADNDKKTLEFVTKVVAEIQQLANNEKILFHCLGGVGRSSMMIALVMASFGYDVDEIFAKITHARGEQAPETNNQFQWVKKLSNSILEKQ